MVGLVRRRYSSLWSSSGLRLRLQEVISPHSLSEGLESLNIYRLGLIEYNLIL